MSKQVNPLRRRVVINGSGGAAVIIRLTTWAKYLEIEEDPNANAGILQGLNGLALDPFAVSTSIGTNSEPLEQGKSYYEFGDKYHDQSKSTMPLGNPGSGGNTDVPGDPRAFLGTPIASLNSNTATATAVWIREWA